MSLNRQQALHEVLDRVPNHQERPANKISEYFGENVFNLHVMRSYLPDEAYEGILEAIRFISTEYEPVGRHGDP